LIRGPGQKTASPWVPALRRTAQNAAPRPGYETVPPFSVPKSGYPGYWMLAFAGMTA
jgi:hypothetical protein